MFISGHLYTPPTRAYSFPTPRSRRMVLAGKMEKLGGDRGGGKGVCWRSCHKNCRIFCDTTPSQGLHQLPISYDRRGRNAHLPRGGPDGWPREGLLFKQIGRITTPGALCVLKRIWNVCQNIDVECGRGCPGTAIELASGTASNYKIQARLSRVCECVWQGTRTCKIHCPVFYISVCTFVFICFILLLL